MEIEPVINLLGTYKKYKYIADEYGITYETFRHRLKNNLTLEEALTLPVNTIINKPDYSKQKHRYREKEKVLSNDEVILNKLKMGIRPNPKEEAYILENKDKFKEWLR
ncbi:hypothetical protein QNJ24_00110 [Macrococcus caseolyticus]|uniref:hypothetical protein n=1 Tax=Macrococcoides caseolyticum TaxID=69966 RepID=UPI0024BCABA6|nr:hypothetical protein [Macrococcus caseolyticus]MDJ1154484.1 hypothetical protein [Macrococcus caseolyticus]